MNTIDIAHRLGKDPFVARTSTFQPTTNNTVYVVPNKYYREILKRLLRNVFFINDYCNNYQYALGLFNKLVI